MSNINTGLSLSRLHGMLKWWPLIRSWLGAINTAIVLLTCLNTPCCTSPWSRVSCVQLLSASWVSFGFWVSCLYLACQKENGQIHNMSFLFSLFDFLFSVEDWNQALARAKCTLCHGAALLPSSQFLHVWTQLWNTLESSARNKGGFLHSEVTSSFSVSITSKLLNPYTTESNAWNQLKLCVRMNPN